jgi:addiction module HigA family antidote
MAIRTFRSKPLEALFRDGATQRIDRRLHRKLLLILDVINRAETLGDIARLDGFHPLKGNLRGHHGITVTGNWRVTFRMKRLRSSMSTTAIITRRRRPSAPGEILAELYLTPRQITITGFAAAAGLSRKHVSNIIHGHARIIAETAVRIGRALGTSSGMWLGLQNDVDLWDAEAAVSSRTPAHRTSPGAPPTEASSPR